MRYLRTYENFDREIYNLSAKDVKLGRVYQTIDISLVEPETVDLLCIKRDNNIIITVDVLDKDYPGNKKDEYHDNRWYLDEEQIFSDNYYFKDMGTIEEYLRENPSKIIPIVNVMKEPENSDKKHFEEKLKDITSMPEYGYIKDSEELGLL